MEQLQRMLLEYNLANEEHVAGIGWTRQYRRLPFPLYWRLVYRLMQSRSPGCSVLEVGSGCGDVTAILCYQGFGKVVSFERNPTLCEYSRRKIETLFGRDRVFKNRSFPDGRGYDSDILIMVNCAYADGTSTKEEYLKQLVRTYHASGNPKAVYLEVIDESFREAHQDFPLHIRLNQGDIYSMFPGGRIRAWSTYAYPANDKSKTLYEIELS